mmetsp:Transcript_28558/g.94764  ORF Transcript_28558/g.94764 Transcript_28558/m.94764 type:complete len:325 (-) Transcript_28558:48-1022(-)|eukprot:CAMPEP_0203925304 /NCGR_PEP_ID=MMETSP0359-20131031/64965_1 /ASSEMBLY_ACC=CAM_ASM_000338 /TAXON_ID=268821 /ORGANISM="Scrippsiella Hangoei, Strain SHTV-5" /LENGTH=324 /DNA_ID=CAMNT_0050853709 /DNA_START=62 /DNA_END=1036 /DNA_ORIENTATION=-
MDLADRTLNSSPACVNGSAEEAADPDMAMARLAEDVTAQLLQDQLNILVAWIPSSDVHQGVGAQSSSREAPPAPPPDRPPSGPGRFADRLARSRRPRENQDEATLTARQPPSRLHGAVGGEGRDPFSKVAVPAVAIDCGLDFSELPAFKHLDALEAAITMGSAAQLAEVTLPALPGDFGDFANLQRPFSHRGCSRSSPDVPRALAGHGRPLSSRGCLGDSLLSSGGLTVRASTTSRLPPPAAPPGCGARMAQSALRGGAAPLAVQRHGPAATAHWLALEAARMHGEARKPFGSSTACAFLVNGGPARMLPMNTGLVSSDLQRHC